MMISLSTSKKCGMNVCDPTVLLVIGKLALQAALASKSATSGSAEGTAANAADESRRLASATESDPSTAARLLVNDSETLPLHARGRSSIRCLLWP